MPLRLMEVAADPIIHGIWLLIQHKSWFPGWETLFRNLNNQRSLKQSSSILEFLRNHYEKQNCTVWKLYQKMIE